MIINKRNALIKILSLFGYIPMERDTVFCRRCRNGHGVTDEILDITGEHRMTKGMVEVIAYIAQLLPSFERASEALKKMMGIDVSATQMQIISEEVGESVFEEEMEKA